MEIEDINIRSEEVRDILSRPPNALLRWGISAVFLATTILLTLSFLLKYPQVIIAPITITTEQLPASVKAMSSGKIALLLVKEGQAVQKDETMAVIENSGNYAHWKDIMTVFKPFYQKILLGESISRIALGKEVNVGEAQNAYTQFYGAHQNYWNFMETNIYDERVGQLRRKIISQRQLSQGLTEQKAILATDFGLAQRQYQKDKQLYDKKVVTEQELERSQQVILQQEYRVKAAGLEEVTADIRIQELEAQVLELTQQFKEEHIRYLEALKQASLNLESALSAWRQRYVLEAPVTGKVSFFKLWANNHFVNTNDEVMVIIPQGQDLFGYAAVGQAGFGKVVIGQNVNIRLSGFPYEEFGIVKGEVQHISSIARDGKYMVHIALPKGLESNYGKILTFSQEMLGEAHIITEDLRLIERIFYQIRKAWQE